MPLLNIVVALIVMGVILYLINRFIPMAGSIKTILNIVVVCAVCVWVLQAVGLLGDGNQFPAEGLTTSGHLTPNGHLPSQSLDANVAI